MMRHSILDMFQRTPWALLSALAGVAACSASGSAGLGPDGGSDGTIPSAGGFSNSDGVDDSASGGALPPEEEDQGRFRAPVVTGSFLWSANPDSGRVALISARDSSVRLLSAGLRPTHVFAVPSGTDAPKAIVQNLGSADASFLSFDDGDFSERRIPTPNKINHWTISPSGDVALALSLPEDGEMLDPTEGLQEVLVVRLSEPEEAPVRLTVGYRPRTAIIGQDEKRAVIISEDGLSVIRLDGTIEVERWVSLGVRGGLDASVTADATYGVVRREGSPEIEIIPLEGEGETTTLTMGSPVTDLDLGPNGLVVGVARQASEVLSFSMRYFDPETLKLHRATINGATVGSAVITDGGERAVLYTTAVPEERITVLELLPGDDFLNYRTVSTQRAVKAVSTSPDGRYAVVMGASADESQGGFSVVPLDQERFPRIVGTRAPVEAVGLINGGLLVTTAGSETFEAYVGQLPELTVEPFSLASRPLSTGVIDELDLGFVAQSHPEGRITFFSLRGSEVRTVSGYELSAEVIDE
jgi:hypothetical protein